MVEPFIPLSPSGDTHALHGNEIAVLIIDPSALGRGCTLAALQSAEGLNASAAPHIGQAPEGEQPDLLLFQGFGSGKRVAELLDQLEQAAVQLPNAAAVVVVDEENEAQMLESLHHGARGYLTSNIGMDGLVDAIRIIRHDLAVYPAHILDIVQDAMGAAKAVRRSYDTKVNEPRFRSLTARQRDVLRLLALGLPNKMIAQQLKISESTVKVHIRAIMTQAGARNRTQILAHFLGHNGLLPEMELR
ncbi:MAG: response regulator transcription factor [Sphingobium sp.]